MRFLRDLPMLADVSNNGNLRKSSENLRRSKNSNIVTSLSYVTRNSPRGYPLQTNRPEAVKMVKMRKNKATGRFCCWPEGNKAGDMMGHGESARNERCKPSKSCKFDFDIDRARCVMIEWRQWSK